MQINVRAGKTREMISFMARVLLAPTFDRLLGRPPKEQAVLDCVLGNAPAGDAIAVLRAMDAYATDQRWMMNIGPRKGSVLLEALIDAGAKRVLEIGTYCGYSATLIAGHLDGAEGSLISLEKDAVNAEIARRIVAHAGLQHRVRVLTGTLSQHLASLQGPFDVVFLDHWKNLYLRDLKRLEAHDLLHAGTRVIADNVGLFNVPDYLDYVRTNPRYSSEYHECTVEYNDKIRDGMEVSLYHG